MDHIFKLLLLPITVPVFCVGFLIRVMIAIAWWFIILAVVTKEYVVAAFDRGLGDQ